MWLVMAGHASTLGAVAVADHLGLFGMLDDAPTAAELASTEEWDERQLEELLFALVAGGLVRHEHGRFSLDGPTAAILSDPRSPYFLAGQARTVADMLGRAPLIAESIRTGAGVDSATYSAEATLAMERMNGPSQRILLPKRWMNALPDIVERLEAGGTAADVGCGAGIATEALARRFPATAIIGYDIAPQAIARARARTSDAGLDNLSFEERSLEELPQAAFDFVLAFDVIHDLPHPVAGLERIRQSLRPDGACLMVEPNATGSVDDSVHPMGALLYAMSAMHCVPVARSDNGAGKGACWGPDEALAAARSAGFGDVSILEIDNLANRFFRLGP